MAIYESDFRGAFDSASGSIKVVGSTGASNYPAGATTVTNSSGNVAAATATATLAGAVGKTTYLTGFAVTGSGATSASIVAVTVTGILGGTATYNLVVPAGVTTSITPLQERFAFPIPGSTTNTAIVVSAPTFGTGNTNAAVVATGYQL